MRTSTCKSTILRAGCYGSMSSKSSRPNGWTLFIPDTGHPQALELIAQTRQYIQDVARAVKSGDGTAAQVKMLAKYHEYRPDSS